MRTKITSLLLVICLAIVGLYHGGCIQSRNYRWQPTEEEKKEVAAMAAEKIAADEAKKKEEQK